MIRFLVHTISSKRDAAGNRQHVSTIRSVHSNDYALRFFADGPRNACALLARLTTDYDLIYETNADVSRSDFKELARNVIKYEYQITLDDIRALEQTARGVGDDVPTSRQLALLARIAAVEAPQLVTAASVVIKNPQSAEARQLLLRAINETKTHLAGLQQE